MKPSLLLLFTSLVITTSVRKTAIDFQGNNLLVVLGTEKNSAVFKQFKSFWALDKNYESSSAGIKMMLNDATDKVEGIILYGEPVQMNGERFMKCEARLPYNLSFSDDTSSLHRKLGNGQKLLGRNTIKFYHGNTSVEVSFRDAGIKQISCVKFSTEKPKATAAIKPVSEKSPSGSSVPSKIENERRTLESSTFTVAPKTEKLNEDPVKITITPFKKAILDVFAAWRDSYFYSVKNDERTTPNFWNYKYTYNTKLKVPGEKYNMLYCFPFASSQPDFVAVLKESDTYDKSLEKTYSQYEKLLSDNFPASEGWTASKIQNEGKGVVPDLEFKNDRYGAVILDYSRNPKGKHVLYLRFLLFSS